MTKNAALLLITVILVASSLFAVKPVWAASGTAITIIGVGVLVYLRKCKSLKQNVEELFVKKP